MYIHPVEELDDGGLVRGEIEKGMPYDGGKNVEIVGQTPISVIMSGLGRKVRRIDEKYYIRGIFVLGEQFAVVGLDDFQPVEVSVASVGRLFGSIVERLLFNLSNVCCVIPGE